MDNTIENLEIRVTTSGDAAANAFGRLASSAERLKGASRGAAQAVSGFTDNVKEAGKGTKEAGKDALEASKNVRNLGKNAKDAGEAAKKGAHGIANFWNQLKRVAFYRFVRTVLKEIAATFKEGITNLYQWSSAVDGRFAKSMDKIATSTLYLKNSLGAMLAPIINTLAPVIDWIVDRIVDVINWINKLFAALSGSQTYTVAKKVATTWADAGKSAAGSARSAADDIKRTILGFDEINKLEKQNTSSGGSGSGNSTPGIDYTDMFEERRLDGWMSKLASFIDKFNLQIPAVFGTILGGFAAIKAAISAVSKLSLGWLKDMAGKTITIGVKLIRRGWETLKGWALRFGEAVVDLAVRIKTSALELWAKFSAAWSVLNPVLKVGIIASVTAAALWLALQLDWSKAPEKILQVKTAIVTTAQKLWRDFQQDWYEIGQKVLGFSVVISTTAAYLWQTLQKAWGDAKSHVLKVSVVIATTASALWTLLKNTWNREVVGRALQVSAAISTAASDLWQKLKEGWGDAKTRVLNVGARIVTAVSGLWETLKSEWYEHTRTLNVGIKPEFAADGSQAGATGSTWYEKAWSWIKKNWIVVAAAGLGVAVAISTGPAALGTMLSTLWGKAVAFVGGVLPFAVAPALAESNDPYYKSGSQYTQDFYDKNIAPLTSGFGGATAGGAQYSEFIGAGRKSTSSTSSTSTTKTTYFDSDEAKKQLQKFNEVVKNGWKAVSETTAKLWTEINGSVINGLKNIETAITLKIPVYNNLFSKGMYAINSTVALAMTQMLSTYLNGLNNIETSTNIKFNSISSTVQRGWYQVNANTATAMTQMVSSVINGMNNVNTVVANRSVSIANTVAGIGWNRVGNDIVYGIGRGIYDTWDWLKSVIKDLAKATYNAAKKALGINSPSKVFSDGVGKMIGLGMAQGIDNSARSVMDSMDALNANMLSRLTPYTQVGANVSGTVEYAMESAASVAPTNTDNRQQEVAVLQSILDMLRYMSENPIPAEITASSVQRALNRSNVRAGVTTVPVGQ